MNWVNNEVVCVQLAHLSIGDWKDISIAHVIIIIKSKVSTFPIVFIFFRGCVPEMFVHILSLIVYTFRENQEFILISIVQFMMSANSRIHFGLQIVFVCLFITSLLCLIIIIKSEVWTITHC